MIVVHVLCIFIMLDFIKKAMIKIKVMTTYNPNILHVQTYCVFSLYQLRALILCLIINVLLNMLGIFKIALGSKYLNFFLTYKQLNCKNCSNLELTPIKYFESVMWILICQLLHFVNWMQIFEWKAMIYIIETQQDRGVGQITFDYHNEDVKEISRFSLKLSNSQQSFRRNEIVLRRRWFSIVGMMILVHFSI